MIKVALTFDDVLMVPKYSTCGSRKNIYIRNSIIPANMKSIAGREFLIYCYKNNYPFILNRYASKEDVELLLGLAMDQDWDNLKAISIGVLPLPKLDITRLNNYNIGICIDVAHGHHKLVRDTIEFLRKRTFSGPIIAGNVCTAIGFYDLTNWGADYIRVGVGNGSVCTTRLATGHGVPQLQAIMDCNSYRKKRVKLIADGGVKTPGDIAKAFGAGADYVMTGSMFAGTDKATDLQSYSGMASLGTKEALDLDPSFIEGVTKMVYPKGPGSTDKVYKTINEGLKSAISYSGFDSLEEFIGNAEFIRVSPNTVKENGVHFND